MINGTIATLRRFCGKDLWILVSLRGLLTYIRVHDIFQDPEDGGYICYCNYVDLYNLDAAYDIPSSEEQFTDYEYNINRLNATEELYVEDIAVAQPIQVLTTDEFYDFLNDYCRSQYPDDDYDGDYE